jgi:hypothetical protein
MKFILWLAGLVCGLQAVAQTGSISGKIVDAKTGEDMIGAIVQLEGTSLGAASDFDGTYTVRNVPSGVYQIKVSFISFTTKVIDGVVVKPGATTELNISMEEVTLQGKEVEIVDFKRTDTEASVLIEMKEAKGVLSGMSAAQIAKGQDRDASEVARRIPGVTVMDNRFVIVRGLSERYNAVSLNNALAPSFESDVKSFAFDVIPSQLIERFLVYKSPSADLQGEFAGGAINIWTKTMPEQDFTIAVDMGTGFRSQTTFENFRQTASSGTDWMGRDAGLRQLPVGFPDNVRNVFDNPEVQQQLGRSLPNTWDYDINRADLDKRMNVLFGKKMKWGKVIVGSTTAINYSNTKVGFLSEREDYNTWDVIQQRSDTIFSYNDSIFQQQARLGVMQNFGFRFGRKHSVDVRALFNQTGLAENTFRTGANFEEGSFRREYSYRYNERFIFSGQLNGKHELFANRGTLDWTGGFARTERSDPDWRRVRYTLPFESEVNTYQAYIPFSAQPFFLGRLYIGMKESKVMGAANYEHKLKDMGEGTNGERRWLTVKTGFYAEQRDRTFSIRNIGYASANPFLTNINYPLLESPVGELLNPENINNTNGLKLDEDTQPSDSYRAANTLVAGYAMVNIPWKRWNVSGGVRLEQNRQTLNSFTITDQPLEIIQDSLMILPSANISYNLTEKSLIRFAYGKTVNRPEFRELAPYYFYDFVFNAIQTGNDTLRFATIDNFDLRWEWYPRPTEFVSAGLFYKSFVNPIELYFVPGVGSGGTRSFRPGNAPSAVSYGIEVDVRKSLNNVFTNKILQRISITANASLIQSRIVLSDRAAEDDKNNTRPMMGQSPYVINAGLYYQDDNAGWEAAALYNIVGPRVVIVGIPGIPEVYEMQRNLLDFSITKTIKKNWSVRVGVQDVLNQPIVLLQDANEDGKLSKGTDQSMQRFRRGAYWTLTLRYRFSR